MTAEELYELPLDQFVAERGALARALRAAGRVAEAGEVSRLRKPSVAAWAVNQLIRTQVRVFAELFDAGDALRQAQEDVLAGRGGGLALRVAAERERAAVDELVSAARGLLTSDGHELGAMIIDRVADTAHAAALDDAARAEVRGGRLVRELHHVGLGIGAGTGAVRPMRPTERNRSPKASRTAEAAERDRARERRSARAAESKARRAADSAGRALRVAQQRRDSAATALRTAEDALSAARLAADAAEAAHRAAKEQLGRI